jgi:hypothetical protein
MGAGIALAVVVPFSLLGGLWVLLSGARGSELGAAVSLAVLSRVPMLAGIPAW